MSECVRSDCNTKAKVKGLCQQHYAVQEQIDNKSGVAVLKCTGCGRKASEFEGYDFIKKQNKCKKCIAKARYQSKKKSGVAPSKPTPVAPAITDTQELIDKVCDEVKAMLLDKNRKYGDSALNPSRVFSKADTIEQLNVRIDDKLSRIASAQDDDTEDAEWDLIGYLILKRVALYGGG